MRAALALPVLLIAGREARATWPERPLRLIVPFAPGSGTDILARLLAGPMARQLGQPVVIDNRPGANGVLGAQAAATASPDGYTLVIVGTSVGAINPHLLRRLPYDPLRDFAPVGGIAEQPYLLTLHPEGPPDLAAFLAEARRRRDEITFSHGNAGSLIMAHMLANMAGTAFTAVPYRGGAEALAEVAAKRIDFTFADFPLGIAQHRGGRVRAIAQSLARPFPLAPEIPPLATALPGFDANVWFTMAAPAGTPQALVARTAQALAATLDDPDFAERLVTLGYVPLRKSPAEVGDFLSQQVAIWGERVRTARIEPQ